MKKASNRLKHWCLRGSTFSASLASIRRRRRLHRRREQPDQLRRNQGTGFPFPVCCRVAQAVAGQAALRVPGEQAATEPASSV